jgi:SpoVK/Ycf46/Vps4 family AAA+-type ATPase
LYRINLGRFSGKGKNSNENLEGEIERIFANARAWDTILLIDEAEAIMLERTPDNIDLNSWVSGKLPYKPQWTDCLTLQQCFFAS